MAVDFTQGPVRSEDAPNETWVSMHFSTYGHIRGAFDVMLEKADIPLTPQLRDFRHIFGVECAGSLPPEMTTEAAPLIAALAKDAAAFCDPRADYDPGIQETTGRLAKLMQAAADNGREVTFG